MVSPGPKRRNLQTPPGLAGRCKFIGVDELPIDPQVVGSNPNKATSSKAYYEPGNLTVSFSE